jgi:diphthamide biosynthesis protein 2
MAQQRVPAELRFDDGSRVMKDDPPNETSCNEKCVRGNMSIRYYFEINRLSQDVLDLLNTKPYSRDDGWLCRIALQFPDSLLQDAAEVCWEFEGELKSRTGKTPLVFVLGDTTFGSCCPDEVSAMHLDADVLIHFGHACLSPAASIPIIYSFGMNAINVAKCVEDVLEQLKDYSNRDLLLLSQVQYYHVIHDIQSNLSNNSNVSIFVGKIPNQDLTLLQDNKSVTTSSFETVGGLQIPLGLDLTKLILLYIGDPSDNRQFKNIVLRFHSVTSSSKPDIWTFDPNTSNLSTSVPTFIQRELSRRFFLVQKARDATTFGILVGTLSQRHFTSVVHSLQRTIQNANRFCYTFVVGKINEAKLANFGEIDCYILVACSETSLLDFERDLHVPVITPLELDVALGNREWGKYSLDYHDYLQDQNQTLCEPNNIDNDEEDKDAPYFSLVSGNYVDSRKQMTSGSEVNLSALPGKGQLTTYQSKGAEFLKSRQFQGLETLKGETEVHEAVPGLDGIASDYGELDKSD